MFPRLRSFCRWLGVRLLVAVAVWAVAYTSLNYYLTGRRDRALAWFAAQGIPTSHEEFPKSEVAPKDDAGPVWRAAADLAQAADLKAALFDYSVEAKVEGGRMVFSRSHWDAESGTHVEQPVTAEELEKIRKSLADNQVVLDLLHQAALRPKYQSPLDYSLGYAMLLPQAMESQHQAKLLCVAADLAVQDGQVDRAIEYWTSLRGLQRMNVDEPNLVCQLVAAGAEGQLCLSIQRGLAAGAFGEKRLDGDLAQVAALLVPFRGYREQFRRSIEGEVCSYHEFFRSLIEGRSSGLFNPPPRSAAGPIRLLWLADETAGLGLWRRLLESGTPGALPSEVVRLNRSDIPTYAFMTHLIMPAISGAATQFAKAEAARRVTAWSVALVRHRLATGEYPKSLADVKAELARDLDPNDPFTGKPLVYRLTQPGIKSAPEGKAAGFFLYSVGPNMVDDGGANGKTPGTADDIAFALEP